MDTTEFERVLREKEQTLLEEIAALTRSPGYTGSISFGKRIGEGTSLAVDRLTSVAVHEQLLDTLAQVRTALDKIGRGTYEVCDVCGRPIGQQRLEARPWALRCRDDS